VLVLEVFVGHRHDYGHKVDDALDARFVGLEHAVPSFLGEIGDANFELEDGEFELLHFLLDVLGVEVADVRLFPSLLQLDEAVEMSPQKFPIVEFDLHVLQLLVGTGGNAHQFLDLHIGIVLLLLLEDILLDAVQFPEGFGGGAVFVNEFVAHECGLNVLDVSGQDFDALVDGFLHRCSLLVDHLLRLLQLVLQVGVFLFQQLQLACLVARNVAVKFLQLGLHALDFYLLVLERFVSSHYHVEVLDVLAVLLEEFRVGLQAFCESVDSVFGFVHAAHHERGELFAINVDFGLEFGGEFVCNFDAVDVETALGDILDSGLYVAIPLSELMDLLPDLFKRHVPLLPVRHLERVEETEYLPHLLVVLLYVLSRYPEIATHLLQHLAANSVEIY